MSFIDIHDLSVTYKGKNCTSPALAGISLSIEMGETCIVTGPSGCGKSTLLKVLADILQDYRGKVLIDGTAPDAHRHNTALIQQSYGLLPWKTVKQNIALGASIKDIGWDNALYERTMSALAIADIEHKYPGELSGGQRQRAAIARAVMQKPCMLLMDEPFSALDAMTSANSRKLIYHMLKDRQTNDMTTVMVTHNIDEAVYMGNRIVVLTGSPGRLFRTFSNSFAGCDDDSPERRELISHITATIKHSADEETLQTAL